MWSFRPWLSDWRLAVCRRFPAWLECPVAAAHARTVHHASSRHTASLRLNTRKKRCCGHVCSIPSSQLCARAKFWMDPFPSRCGATVAAHGSFIPPQPHMSGLIRVHAIHSHQPSSHQPSNKVKSQTPRMPNGPTRHIITQTNNTACRHSASCRPSHPS